MTEQLTFDPILLHPHLPPDLALGAYWVRGRGEASELSKPAAVEVDAEVRSAVRALLRWGGHKPSGRGRPASESLAKALEEDRWPTITPCVDECNRLSLISGLPISVLDAAKVRGPFEVRLGSPGEEYVFNPSGQVLSLKGLLLFSDGAGPTGGPVKDAQRSKVDSDTDEHLILVWGSAAATSASGVVEQGLKAWCELHKSCLQTLPIRRSLGE